MKQILARVGCLVSVLATLTAIVVYPRANWLFAFVLIGILIVVLDLLRSKKFTPREVADFAERILRGHSQGWDIDDYEHLNPRDPHVKDLWRSTMTVGGLPEEWVRLDEAKKRELLEIIQRLRTLDVSDKSANG